MAKKNKDTFIARTSWYDFFDEDTTWEQKGKLFDAILRYKLGDENACPDDPEMKGVFKKIKKEIQETDESYQKQCEKNAENARKRWAEKNRKGANGYDRMRAHTSEYGGMHDSDSDNDSEYEYPSGIDSENDSNNPPVLPNGNTVPPSGGGRKKPAPKAVYSPDPALDDAIHEFVKHRKAMRKPMTDKAIELFINKLNKLAPGDNDKQIRLINTAIEHGWQSVYEDKQSNVTKINAAQAHFTEMNSVIDQMIGGGL